MTISKKQALLKKQDCKNHLGAGNSTILVYFHPDFWGFMILFDGMHIFFRWVGE